MYHNFETILWDWIIHSINFEMELTNTRILSSKEVKEMARIIPEKKVIIKKQKNWNANKGKKL